MTFLIYFIGYWLYASVVSVMVLMYVADHTKEAEMPEIYNDDWTGER